MRQVLYYPCEYYTLTARNLLEVLPKAPATKPAQLTDAEEKALWDQEEAVLRELRLFLRDMLNKLARDRKFNIFAKPVDDEEVRREIDEGLRRRKRAVLAHYLV